MKRLLSLALSAALLAALTLPAAAAEETQDARLAKVTALVKEALALDTEAYETFHGGLTEDLVPLWNLSWEGENRSLSVSALEDGTVVSLYRWESETAPAGYRWCLSIPFHPWTTRSSPAKSFTTTISWYPFPSIIRLTSSACPHPISKNRYPPLFKNLLASAAILR